MPGALKPFRQNSDLHLYDRLYADAHPKAGGKEFLHTLNPNSLKLLLADVGPSLDAAQPGQKFHFERFRCFAAGRADHVARTKPVFNRVTGLKNSWEKYFI